LYHHTTVYIYFSEISKRTEWSPNVGFNCILSPDGENKFRFGSGLSFRFQQLKIGKSEKDGLKICKKYYIVQELTNGSPECQAGQSPNVVAKVTSSLYNPFFKNCAQF